MVYAAIIAATIAIDQASKLLTQRLGLTVSFNTGTAFGLFKGFPGAVTVLAIAALVCMVVVVFCLRELSPVVRIGLALAAGGAASNIIDRVTRGMVLDWIYCPFSDAVFSGGLRFNLADVAVGLGLFAVALVLFAESRYE